VPRNRAMTPRERDDKMIEKLKDGVRVWEPTHPQDIALLQRAEGSLFGETTFPSGWKSPAGTQTARNGVLVENIEGSQT